MRGKILVAVAALSLGSLIGASVGGYAVAQNAPPPGMDAPMHGGPGMGPMHQMHHPMASEQRPFGLFYHPADRKLTTAEVQKIAEGFLLWQGNRTWKVTEVAEAPDNAVSFALATGDGSVVARFSMDRATGRVKRTG
jgi:hypothetical protein